MIIETRSIAELKPAPYNPRLELKPGDKAWEKLERSLDEFELVQPIVWNKKTGHIVSGHQRLAVLKHRGETEVDCVVVDFSLEKEKALNVTLNNANVGSDWDAAKLVDLVSELQSLPEFDATLTGFDDQQLSDLILAPAWDDGSSSEDESDLDENIVRVTLEVPRDEWEEVRTMLDDILAENSTIRLHVNP